MPKFRALFVTDESEPMRVCKHEIAVAARAGCGVIAFGIALRR